ncbi:2-dehydropantoate 2-reductase [Trinickia caryophylli]|uniref:2-dehydropantoate 2-reductase n=1 Tax=Trinickia caryophylli TaxID=28094 RepID=A0A1X7G565_TRICW|nr:2-dehydropantoate 2-reductase [Trinickia caryophylli]PMS13798.1 2-dehydropantoate 2-reductase [Trinickia caryophylli]TRX14299.1 2-dehydropantoate 2-reductase [Trinickia caryophylli]WQE14128.1 2-dehydropantoate 2-reductase [Trinickia caryophylli]SMF64165.1 ketopantoate reductase [Trinickia caryophylli]GLU33373.1 2-dehydropantoate 2-reductase [Trinickia caryophylli]
MRILIVGAGAIGGYVGARLLAARKDVTFLVRPRRAAQLAQAGLRLESPLGSCAIPSVRCVTATTIDGTYGLVIIACKAFDLSDALTALSPAVGTATAVLPLLNGIAHIDDIAHAFGQERVLGGQCTLAASLAPEGGVRHLNDSHALTLGELDGTPSPRVDALASLFADAGFGAAASRHIRLEMWEKFAFVASAICMTVLTRVAPARRGDAAHGRLAAPILSEFRTIASSAGFALRPMALARARMILDAPEPTLADLIFDDLRSRAIESDRFLEDVLRHAQRGAAAAPLFADAHAALRSYRDTVHPA